MLTDDGTNCCPKALWKPIEWLLNTFEIQITSHQRIKTLLIISLYHFLHNLNHSLNNFCIRIFALLPSTRLQTYFSRFFTIFQYVTLLNWNYEANWIFFCTENWHIIFKPLQLWNKTNIKQYRCIIQFSLFFSFHITARASIKWVLFFFFLINWLWKIWYTKAGISTNTNICTQLYAVKTKTNYQNVF